MIKPASVEKTTRSHPRFTVSTLIGAALFCTAPFVVLGCTTSGVVRPPAAFAVSSATPPHNLPKHEYPFDAEGNYRTDWLDPNKSSNKQVAPSHKPTQVASSSTPSSTRSTRSSGNLFTSSRSSSKPSSTSSSRSSSPRTTVASAPSPPPPKPAPVPIPTQRPTLTQTPTPAPTPKLEPAPAPKPPPPPPAPKPQTRYHTVARGETLWAISRRYSKTVDAIKSANGLSSDLIKPGQKLKIP